LGPLCWRSITSGRGCADEEEEESLEARLMVKACTMLESAIVMPERGASLLGTRLEKSYCLDSSSCNHGTGSLPLDSGSTASSTPPPWLTEMTMPGVLFP